MSTEKHCAYKRDMFSKASRLFFKENQEISYILTDKFWFEFYYYKFNSMFKQQTFSNMKLTKNA